MFPNKFGDKLKLKSGDALLKKAFNQWIKNEQKSDGRFSPITSNHSVINALKYLYQKQLVQLMKKIGLVAVKKENLKGNKNGQFIQ